MKTENESIPVNAKKPDDAKPKMFTPKTYEDLYRALTHSTKNKPVDWFTTDFSQLDQRVLYVRNDALPVILGIVNIDKITGLRFIVINHFPHADFFFNKFLPGIPRPVTIIVDETRRRHYDNEGALASDISEFVENYKMGRTKTPIAANANVKAIIFRVHASFTKLIPAVKLLAQAHWYPMQVVVVGNPVQLIGDFVNDVERTQAEPKSGSVGTVSSFLDIKIGASATTPHTDNYLDFVK